MPIKKIKQSTKNKKDLRNFILKQTALFYKDEHASKKFIPGKTYIPVSGRVFDENEIRQLVDASLDFWLTTGRFAEQFEKDLRAFLGITSASLCNSGSSANLLAMSALTSPQLKERALKPGDEVITVAAGFPSTINPIIQNRLIPVFVDIDEKTYNIDVQALENAITPKTRVLIAAHTLGNPFDLEKVMALAHRHNLWVIEDNCDALGSTYQGKFTGTFGDLATLSFYPAHHITMGEGGCVLTNNRILERIVWSFRDWGRDCWCDPGKENTCGKRFNWQLGDLPYGYDHKYIYSHIGYNLKLTDMQAAVGVAQLKKLPKFIARRKQNWKKLHAGLTPYQEFLNLPQATAQSDPSWFGFLLTVKPQAPFSRNELTSFLEEQKIATRLLFGGNLIRQPAYKNTNFRIAGNLTVSDMVMERSFWIGVYPGITDVMIDHMLSAFKTFVRKFKKS